MSSSTHLNSIEVREGEKGSYISTLIIFFFIIALIFIIPSQRQNSINFFSEWSFSKVPAYIVFLAFPIFCLWYYFDKKIKVRIDKEGVWTKQHSIIKWEDVWYFYSTVSKIRQDDVYYLKLKLKDTTEYTDKEIKISFCRMDKEFAELRSVVEFYTSSQNIKDLGHDREV